MTSEQELLFKDFYNQGFITSGTYGSVHKVHNKATGDKSYAIKSVFLQHGADPDPILREIKIWETLETQPKPNALPKFYGFREEDLGFSGKSYHLIFDFFPKSLQSVIKDLSKSKKGPFPFQKLLAYANSMINAMAFLQTLKICHRDLKPANLLLDESEEHIYIIDLGESKEIGTFTGDNTKSELTVAGSPKYFSPEMFAAFSSNDRKVEVNPFKADVFSFGLVFLELGIQHLPKQNNDLEIWEKSIRKKIRQFKKTYQPLMSNDEEKARLREFINVLTKCLRMDPLERPDFVRLFCRKMRNSDSERIKQHILLEEKDSPKMVDVCVRVIDEISESSLKFGMGLEDQVLNMKKRIEEVSKIALAKQRIFFRGEEELQDKEKLSVYGLGAFSTVFLVPRKGRKKLEYQSSFPIVENRKAMENSTASQPDKAVENHRQKQVFVKFLGRRFPVDVEMKVYDLKKRIEERLGIEPDRQKLYFQNKELIDNTKITEASFQNGSNLEILIKD